MFYLSFLILYSFKCLVVMAMSRLRIFDLHYSPPAVIIQHITMDTTKVISTTRVTTQVTMHLTPPATTHCPTAVTQVTAAAAATVEAMALIQVSYFLYNIPYHLAVPCGMCKHD